MDTTSEQINHPAFGHPISIRLSQAKTVPGYAILIVETGAAYIQSYATPAVLCALAGKLITAAAAIESATGRAASMPVAAVPVDEYLPSESLAFAEAAC